MEKKAHNFNSHTKDHIFFSFDNLFFPHTRHTDNKYLLREHSRFVKDYTLYFVFFFKVKFRKERSVCGVTFGFWTFENVSYKVESVLFFFIKRYPYCLS